MDQEDIEVFDIESYVRFGEKMDKSRRITRILEKALINRGIHPMDLTLILSIAHTKRGEIGRPYLGLSELKQPHN